MGKEKKAFFKSREVFLVPLSFVGEVKSIPNLILSHQNSLREILVFFFLIGDASSEEGDRQTLRFNYTDDASTQMHRSYGNLMK